MHWRKFAQWRRRGAALALGAACCAGASGQTLSFGLLPQRSATLTAPYGHPILNHVSARRGVTLELKWASPAPEHSAMFARGDFDLDDREDDNARSFRRASVMQKAPR